MTAKTKKPAKKGGKKAAMKPTKEETTEVSTGLSLLLGHNDPPSKDLLYHMDTIAGLQTKAKSAAGKVSEAKKKAKEAGVDMNAVALTLKALNMDVIDLASMLRQQAILFRERGMPVQLSLYEPVYGSPEEQGKAEGWSDGTNGRNLNVARWPDGALGSKEYGRAYNDAQAHIITNGAQTQQ